MKEISVKTNFGEYIINLVKHQGDKEYTVTVPKLKGCITCATSVTNAKINAKEAIELYLEDSIQRGFAKLVGVNKRQFANA